MGKDRREKGKSLRHNPLLQQMEDSDPRAPVIKKAKMPRQDDEEADDEYVGPALSKRILDGAREQQEEIEAEEETSAMVGSRRGPQYELSDDEHDEFDHDDDDDEDIEAIEVTEADEKALAAFLGHSTGQTISLADMIMQKIEEKKLQDVETEDPEMSRLNAKIIEVYTEIGHFLSHYRSGQLPKAFKMVPSLPNWMDVLYLTEPHNWTPNAMYQATRIFSGSVKANMAQSFFNVFLLPSVRDDIRSNKKLNFHLYQALRKALFKPAAFFKGFLIPLLESQTCTLRESNIIGSVLSKVSIPVLHSSAALLRLAELSFNPATEMCIGLLINKKYALPYRVVDALVVHYQRALSAEEDMPVVWHQSLLIFLQRYKNDLSTEARDVIRTVLKRHIHHQMTAECYRELDHAVTMSEPEQKFDMDM